MAASVLPNLTSNSNQIAGTLFWFVPRNNTEVSYSDLVSHLTTSGLDAGLALQLAQTYAFNRGVSALARGKLKDRVEWSQDKVSIQVSARVIVPGGIDYVREATVSLDRATGQISCPDPVVKAKAETEFNKAMGTRKTNDVTRLINRVIAPHVNVSVFPTKGGTYFALVGVTDLVNKLETFANLLGWTLFRWEIADGTHQNVTQVQNVVVDSFMTTLMETEEYLNERVNSDTKEFVVRRSYDKLSDTFDKLRGAKSLIGDAVNKLEDKLAYLEKLLGIRKVTPPTAEVVEPSPRTAPPAFSAEGSEGMPESTPIPSETEDGEPVYVNPPSEPYRGPVTVGVNTDPPPDWSSPNFNPALGLS